VNQETDMARTQWNFDPAHSTVGFRVRHMMFSKVSGKFSNWNGHFEFDPESPSNSNVKVDIDASSIDTGVADRDGHLRSADFFNAETHPSLTFESTAFETTGKDTFKLMGHLTIRGATLPVELDVDFHGQGTDPWGNTRVGFSARGSISRKEFGLTWNQALEAGGVLVGDTVELELEVQAVKQG
jgi:polyisoprenoid-binding protein YceI